MLSQYINITLKIQHMSNQLQMFEGQTSAKSTSSLSVAHAKISHLLENVKGLTEEEVASYLKQLDSLENVDLAYLFGKTLKELSPQTIAKTLQRYCKRLPTLGYIDSNGNCLIQSGFYPKIERESTLSDILEEEVDHKYFLSQKVVDRLMSYRDNMQIPVPSQQDTTQE